MPEYKTFSYEATYKVKDKKRRRKKRVYLAAYVGDTRAELFHKALDIAMIDTEDNELLESVKLMEG